MFSYLTFILVEFVDINKEMANVEVVPSVVIDEESRKVAFDTAVDFINTAYRRHGWVLES